MTSVRQFGWLVLALKSFAAKISMTPDCQLESITAEKPDQIIRPIALIGERHLLAALAGTDRLTAWPILKTFD
jgi:hypothetical protein